jgi:hypothetical protein
MSDEVTSRYVTSGSSTLPLTIALRNDGWGKPMTYYPCTTPITVTSDPTAIAYRIVSGGSNLSPATLSCGAAVDSTDVVFDVTVGTMKTLYAKSGNVLPP